MKSPSDLKRCFKCLRVLPLEMFYRHPMMADGRLGKCKECAKADVRLNYREKHEEKCEYERVRNQRPERRAAKHSQYLQYKEKHPDRYRAHAAVSNAIRDGRLKREPCACGNPKSEAHHADYSKPLDVKWVCFRCHREDEHGQQIARAF